MASGSLAIMSELVGRELAKQALLASKMTKNVLEDKMVIYSIVEHISEVLGPDELEAKEMEEEDALTDVEGEGSNQKGKMKEANELSSKLPAFYISEIMDAHSCRCEACEPNVMANHMEAAVKRARLFKETQIEGAERQRLVDQYRMEHSAWAEQEARSQLVVEARSTVAIDQGKERQATIKAEIETAVKNEIVEAERRKGWNAAYENMYQSMNPRPPPPPMPAWLLA